MSTKGGLKLVKKEASLGAEELRFDHPHQSGDDRTCAAFSIQGVFLRPAWEKKKLLT
jgi:hypothetical protein